MNNTISYLQILRGLSIILVVSYHISLPFGIIRWINRDLWHSTWWGVNIFLVLSGFLITTSITKYLSIRAFLIKRALRIYPPLFFLISLAAVLHIFTSSIGLQSDTTSPWFASDLSWIRQTLFILSGVLVPLASIFETHGIYSYGAMWSLSVEMQFYISIAFLYFIVRKLYYNSTKFLNTILAILLILCEWQRFIGNSIPTLSARWLEYLVHNRFDFILAGCCIVSIPTGWRVESILQKYRVIVISSVVIGTSILLTFCPPPEINHEDSWRLRYIGLPISLISSVLLVFTCRTINSSLNKGNYNTITILLSFAGDISYSLYLGHFLCMEVAWIILKYTVPWVFNSGGLYGIMQILLLIVLLVPYVLVSYYYIESNAKAFSTAIST
jgi:peptidoglycan/LPS O-acetylase OafA/YrhL